MKTFNNIIIFTKKIYNTFGRVIFTRGRMKNSRYTIVFDTNMLGTFSSGNLKVDDFGDLSISKEVFNGLIKFLQDNKILDNVKLAVPKIVFEELISQQIVIYNESIKNFNESFNKFKRLLGQDFKFYNTEEYKDYLEQKAKAFAEKYRITIIDYPENDILPDLIRRALNKEKPFYKNGKDSGFKDAIIWESLIKFAKENKKQNYILFSNDSDLNCEELKEEFSKRTKCDLEIKNSLGEIKPFLDDIYKMNLNFEYFNRVYNQTFIANLTSLIENHYKYIILEGRPYNILSISLGNYIYDMDYNKVNNRYEITIPMTIEHETFYTPYVILDELYEYYAEASSSGFVKLIVEEKENKKLLIDICFKDVSLFGNSHLKEVNLDEMVTSYI